MGGSITIKHNIPAPLFYLFLKNKKHSCPPIFLFKSFKVNNYCAYSKNAS